MYHKEAYGRIVHMHVITVDRGSSASPGPFSGHSSVLAAPRGVWNWGAAGGTMDMDMARAWPSWSCNIHHGGGTVD